MREISEQTIAALSPDSVSTANAKKIVAKGGFVKLSCSEDDSFYLGECSGSGKSNYITSVDFNNPDNIVFRCSCPSRKFPCKHGLALMYEILNKKKFELIDVPKDIIDKRTKIENKQQTKTEQKDKKKTTTKKNTGLADSKKLKKQLEGLDFAEHIISELLTKGLGTLEGNSINVYKDLAKQLGDYYLPGPQNIVRQFMVDLKEIQNNPSDINSYSNVVNSLVRLSSLIKKSRTYINEKLSSNQLTKDNNQLYESLGGVWRLESLGELGLKKENVKLIQLAYNSYFDESKEDFIDVGYWLDADTGELVNTYNYRPINAVKFIKQENSILSAIVAPEVYYYPGDFNKRVRWEQMHIENIKPEELKIAAKSAVDIKSAIKTAKNYLKNTLSSNTINTLIAFNKIGKIGNSYVLEDKNGDRLMLESLKGSNDKLSSTYTLPMLLNTELSSNKILFGEIFFNKLDNRISLNPLSIITNDKIFRTLF